MVAKIEGILLSLDKEEADKMGREVERLIRTDMKYLVNKYINQYFYIVSSTFGWTKDDIRQNIRIAMWKGLATFDESKGYKVTTYLSSILYYYFISLSKKCQSFKNARTKLYCVEKIFDNIEDSKNMGTAFDKINITGIAADFLIKLTPKEKRVFNYYIGDITSIKDISDKTGMHVLTVRGIVKTLKRKMRKQVILKEDKEGALHYEDISGYEGEDFGNPIKGIPST